MRRRISASERAECWRSRRTRSCWCYAERVQRKLVLLGLTLATIGLVLWFVDARRAGTSTVADDRPAPAGQVQDSAAVPETEAPREARADATAPAAKVASVRVRSSAGIPLAFVEIGGDSTWKRADL